MSWFAADTARMMQLGLAITSYTICLMMSAMFMGWSPTGTLVSPGRSTRVRLSTDLECTRRMSGSLDTALLAPATLSVSDSIVLRTSSNEKNFLLM